MYLNIDINSTVVPFLNRIADGGLCTEETLYPFVDEFAGTRVTDILFCIYCQYSAVDSEVVGTYADKYLQKTENGVNVNYEEYFRGYYAVNRRFGYDPYAVWIRRTAELGMRPWLSFRMNDCHCPEEEACFLREDFFYEAKAKGWMNGERYGYFKNTLNYKYPEVRAHFLDYIREQLGRYDVCGIELDFMREPVCFDYAGEDKDICAAVMNGFMREVKGIVTDAEAVRGHRIEIAARVKRDLEKSLAFGFDAVTWAREGLVDVLIPSPRWQTGDSGIPIGEWKRACPDARILGCLETLMTADCTVSNGHAHTPVEAALGYAARFLADGADGIYTFNYFGEQPERDKAVQKALGTHEEICKHPLRFVTTGEDMCPEGFTPYSPLPLREADGERSFRIPTGTIPSGKTATLVLGFTEGAAEDVSVGFNGAAVTAFCPSPMPAPQNAAAKGTYCYAARVPLQDGVQTVSVQGKGRPYCITWLELDVR